MADSGFVSWIALVVSVGNLLWSYFLTKKYGDVAAAATIIEHEDKKAADVRRAALQSLRNEVVRIRKTAERNAQVGARLRLPVRGLETALMSGGAALDAGEKLVCAAAEYLLCADEVNLHIDSLGAGYGFVDGDSRVQRGMVDLNVKSICGDQLPSILDALDACLVAEIGAGGRN